jgi:hypothetical protein
LLTRKKKRNRRKKRKKRLRRREGRKTRNRPVAAVPEQKRRAAAAANHHQIPRKEIKSENETGPDLHHLYLKIASTVAAVRTETRRMTVGKRSPKSKLVLEVKVRSKKPNKRKRIEKL